MRLRQAEDAFVNDLFSAAPNPGAPLIDAHFLRSYMDANRAKMISHQKTYLTSGQEL